MEGKQKKNIKLRCSRKLNAICQSLRSFRLGWRICFIFEQVWRRPQPSRRWLDGKTWEPSAEEMPKRRTTDEILDESSLFKSSGESLKSGELQKPLCICSVSHLASGNGGMMLSRWSMSAFHKTSSWANCMTNNADLPSVESKWQAWFKDEQWEDPSRRGWLAASRSRRVINVASKLGKLEQSLP